MAAGPYVTGPFLALPSGQLQPLRCTAGALFPPQVRVSVLPARPCSVAPAICGSGELAAAELSTVASESAPESRSASRESSSCHAAQLRVENEELRQKVLDLESRAELAEEKLEEAKQLAVESLEKEKALHAQLQIERSSAAQLSRDLQSEIRRREAAEQCASWEAKSRVEAEEKGKREWLQKVKLETSQLAADARHKQLQCELLRAQQQLAFTRAASAREVCQGSSCFDFLSRRGPQLPPQAPSLVELPAFQGLQREVDKLRRKADAAKEEAANLRQRLAFLESGRSPFLVLQWQVGSTKHGWQNYSHENSVLLTQALERGDAECAIWQGGDLCKVNLNLLQQLKPWEGSEMQCQRVRCVPLRQLFPP